MWKLTQKISGESFYLLPEKEKYVVGRASSDLILNEDNSISRIHAFLYPGENSVKLIDNTSKYGTFVNGNIETKNGVTKNEPVELKSNDRIRFGVLKNEWILTKIEIFTLNSALTNAQKADLMETLKGFNGKIVEQIPGNARFLTMEKITVTTKFLYALVQKLPIVTCKYWKDFLTAVRTCGKIPQCDNYLPPISEEFVYLNKSLLFSSNLNRKNLFDGKIFYFVNNKHMMDYAPIINKVGGKVEPLNKVIQKSALIDENAIVIHNKATSESQYSQSVEALSDFLRKKSIRLVPDYEIGLAVVNCSINKYCNPKFNTLKIICALPTDPVQTEVLAEETPAYLTQQHIKNSLVIQDSQMSQESAIYEPSQNIETNSTQQLDGNSNENLNSHTNNLEITADLEKLNVSKKRKQSDPENCPSKRLNLSQGYNTGYLYKSTLVPIEPKLDVNGTNGENSGTSGRKRGRFAVLDDSDDDADDLFDFGGTKKSKLSQDKQSQNDETAFSFNKDSKDKVENPSNTNGVAEEPKKLQIALKLPKPIIIKIESNEWLFKNMIKTEIKEEDNGEINDNVNKIEEGNDTKPEESVRSKFIESIKNGFEVRVKPMQLVSRTFGDISNKPASAQNNFKAFVKKQNYRPQKEIIRTVPVHISGYQF